MKNKCLVTGANGFIGKHLVKALEARGDSVQCLSHASFRDPVSLKIIEELKDIDFIFHLAAYGNMASQKDEGEILRANIDGLWNLLQATKHIPYKAFVNVSSSSVFLPYQTIYSATKAAGEDVCKAFICEYQKPIVTVRPYSVYGIGEAEYRFIPTVFRSCLKGEAMTLSTGSHDWAYVDDFVDYLIEVSKMVGMPDMPAVLEFGTGISTSNHLVVDIIQKITGKKANITDRKQLRSWDTLEWKAKEIRGKTTLLQGLTKYYESIK